MVGAVVAAMGYSVQTALCGLLGWCRVNGRVRPAGLGRWPGWDAVNAIEPVMIVVYDPNAGSLNVDGSMATAAGALASSPSVTGQTWVHYTGAYPLGGSAPYGQSKAWVETADFRMEPSTMECSRAARSTTSIGSVRGP